MLVLSRKAGQKIIIGNNKEIVITVIDTGYGDNNFRNVKIGIEASKSIPVHREEIYNRICAD